MVNAAEPPSEAFDSSKPHRMTIHQNPLLWDLWRKMAPPDGPDSLASKMAFHALIKRYQEPHRAYHTVAHLEFLAREFLKHESLFGEDAPAVIAAIFFHDAVYNCESGKDEEASKVIARQVLGHLGFLEPFIERVEAFIDATKFHKALEGDHVMQLFLDMDMAILGAEPNDYERYSDLVRKEYTHSKYTDKEFTVGRIIFLERTLPEGISIFKSPQYADLNAKAERNMRLEMSVLRTRMESSEPAPKP